jgi:rhombotail lipoprotein
MPNRTFLVMRFLGLLRPLAWLGLGFVLLATSACFSLFNARERAHESSSVVAYLYPNQTDPLPPTSIPVLRIPLRVGVLFVPPGQKNARGGYYQPNSGFSEAQKMALLERVAKEFRGRDFIESIEIVPASYLRPGGGFANLDQLRGLLRIDVVALVAYDQVQFTSENFLSLTYWTIVGAYIFHGNKNDTQTLMESAVYDIPSRHLLFRAPGASNVQAGTAGVYLAENLRHDSAKGLEQATDDLIKNLKVQLEDFRERAKKAPDTVAKIERKPGYTGGGNLGAAFAAGLALMLGAGAWQRRR